MGYSKNPITVRKMIGELGNLLHGRPEVWQKGNKADKFAYKLHECMRIAELYPNEFPGLAKAARELTIKVDDGTVMAMPKKERNLLQPPPATMLSTALRSELEEDLSALGPPTILFAPETVAQAIQFWLNTQPSIEPVELRNVTFTNSELFQLVKWAANLEPAWALTHEPGTMNIKLQLDSPELKHKISLPTDDPIRGVGNGIS